MNDISTYRDEELLVLLKEDSPTCDKAFEAIYERYAERLNAYCIFRADSPQDAEEIFEDCWLKLLERTRTGKKLDSILPYLYTIARNLIIDRYRKKNSNKNITLDLMDSESLDKLLNPFDLQKQIENEDLLSIVRAAANCLDDIYKDVFIMHWFGGLKYKEIAEVLDISESSVKMRSNRAMNEIIKILKPYYTDASK